MLVQADRQHPRIVIERGLHPVAVVRVNVHVGDALGAASQQPRDRDRDVVADAEPAGMRGHRVMHAARDGRAGPGQTARAAARVAPATSAEAWCMPGNTGLSPVPSPNVRA